VAEPVVGSAPTDEAAQTASSGASGASTAPRAPAPHQGSASGADRGTEARAARRPAVVRKRGSLDIQSKLLIMLLVVSILSALTAGLIGYRNGTNTLRAAAFERLTVLRESRAREITTLFTTLENAAGIYAEGETAAAALGAMSAGFEELGDSEPTEQMVGAVTRYYSDVFVPRLAENTGTEWDVDGFIPTEPAQVYLQAAYTAPHADFDEAIAVDDAGDGSAWSVAHARFHPFFRDLVERFSYEDLFLVDPEGNVVYSAFKGVDLGTNVLDGPFAGGPLEDAYTQAMRSNQPGQAHFSDFAFDQPSLGAPAAFVASAIGRDGPVQGVLVVQLPVDEINAVMTGRGGWEQDGLGESGETYLVGPDLTMRSIARGMVEDPEAFLAESRGAGTPAGAVEAMRSLGDTVLLQPVATGVARRSLSGEVGTGTGTDYLGQSSMFAYSALDLPALNWGIVARIDSGEALAPVHAFTRNLVLSTAALVLLVCLASLLLAQVFARPVRNLLVGVRAVAAGQLDTTIDSRSADEFGELAGAFNDMRRSLAAKESLIEAQQEEYSKLLLSVMPEPVAERYRHGEQTIAEDHQNVTVLYADLAGFEDYTAGLGSDAALEVLNTLLRALDDAAARHGVERVRSLRSGYLASCGLVVPRVDHAQRMVEFAAEAEDVVERFNATHEAGITLRAGIATGTVTSGLVGRTRVVYDLWGEAVNLAHRVRSVAGRPGVYVTPDVYDRLRDMMRFTPAGQLKTSGGEIPVWVLEGGGTA